MLGVRKQIAVERIKEFYKKLEFDVLVLVEPKVAPRKNVVKKLGVRDL